MNISKHRTFIMGFAALWIWSFHCFEAEFSNGVIAYLKQHIVGRGYSGVDVFILLSGFGLYYLFTSKPVTSIKSYVNYIIHRFKRIFITFIPITMVIAYDRYWSFREFIGRVTTYNMLTRFYNEYSWFALCIVLLYIIAPFVFKGFDSAKNKLVIVVAQMIFIVIADLIIQDIIRYDLNILILHIPGFILGFYFGYLEKNNLWNKKIAYAVGIISMIIAAICECVEYKHVWHEQEIIENIFLSIGLVILLPVIAEALGKIKAGEWIAKMFVFFGMISWEFYCVQEWIYEELYSEYYVNHAIVRSAVCFVLSTTLAYGFLYVFTKLLPKVKKKLETE